MPVAASSRALEREARVGMQQLAGANQEPDCSAATAIACIPLFCHPSIEMGQC